MDYFKTAGEHLVEIRKAEWHESEKEGMTLILQCIKENNEGGFYYMAFNRTLATKGAHTGKPMYQINADVCLSLGMSAPFHPEKITELEGKQAVAKVEEEKYNGKIQMKIKFLNPPRKAAMDFSKANDIWKKMCSIDEQLKAEANAQYTDDIPY